MKTLGILNIALLLILFASCNSKPKVIDADPVYSDNTQAQEAHSHADVHQVVCQDFMHTDKYTYMDVTENGERFWIAIPRKDVEKGATYYYSGGLKKTNFKSQEYDRVFETIYLVADATRVDGSGSGSAVDRALAQQQDAPASTPASMSGPADLVKISDLYANSAQYEGRIVSIKGQCVKINKMIMGRNWVHIDDGSSSGKDLTVTTMSDVPVGTTVTMTGAISLNVDFGAGYKYDVIMQDAKAE